MQRLLSRELFLSGCTAALIVLLITLGTGYLLHSDLFGLRELKIVGCQLTRPEDLASHAHIRKGMNLLFINLMSATAQLENYPYVYKAIVKRKLPDTLEIYVDERKPRAVIKLEDFYLVDERGEIFKKADSGELQYPVLSGLTKDDLYRDRESSAEIIKSALRLIDCMKMEDRFNNAHLEIAIDKYNGLTIITDPDRLEVSVGFEDFTGKLQSLWKIVDDLKGRGLTPQTIYIKSEQKAYVTLKAETGESAEMAHM
jgi:cell division protein FtsQ